MFLSCGGSSESSSSSTTIINNNYTNASATPNLENFNSFPEFDQLNLTSSSPIITIDTTTAPAPYNINNGKIIRLTASGTLTLTFPEIVIFKKFEFVNLTGSNSVVFYKSGSPVGSFPLTAIYQNNLEIDQAVLTLDSATAVKYILWEDIHPTELIDFSLGTYYKISDINIQGTFGAGGINSGYLVFKSPAIVYKIIGTGNITATYLNKTWTGPITEFNYPEQITQLNFSFLSKIYFYQPSKQINNVNIVSHLFSSKYSPYFTTSGTFAGPIFSGTINFGQPTLIKRIKLTSSGTVLVSDGSFTFTDLQNELWTTFITASNIEQIDYGFPIFHQSGLSAPTNLVLTSLPYYALGSTQLFNKDLTITGMADSPGIIFSANGDSKTPLAGLGTININFVKPCWIRSLKISSATTGSINFPVKTYPISNGTLETKDYVFQDYLFVDKFSINFDGVLEEINYLSYIDQILPSDYFSVTEDFSTVSIDFDSTIFDTNVASAYGTPNVAFGGLGIGLGGAAGGGQNSIYRNNATLSNPDFLKPVFIEYIDLINVSGTDTISFYDISNTLIKTINLPDFGQNSFYRLPVFLWAKKIIQTPAISEIKYFINYNRKVVSLAGNSAVPVDILGPEGNFTVKISAPTSATTFTATRKLPSAGSLSAQVSFTDTYVLPLWSANLQIYHAGLNASPNLIHYKIFW